MADQPFLRIPPFPRHRAAPLCVAGPGIGADASSVATALREARVGGAFWGSRPELPAGRDILLAPEGEAGAEMLVSQALAEGVSERCVLVGPRRWARGLPTLAP